jgi:agmatine deiminase
MPAEWERHHATWIGWPHNLTDWPGKFAPIPWVYAEIVRRLAPGEVVRILVNDGAHEARARRVLFRAGVDAARVEFFPIPTNRGWTRDFGPIFVRRGGGGARRATGAPAVRGGSKAIVRFHFNAWAKYDDWALDDRVPELVAGRLGLPLLEATARGRGVVLEGGSIDVNGRGTVLTTEECLLDPAVQCRNPGLTREDMEGVLRDRLGAGNVLWLGKGIAGDDTHGHVDDLCRFTDARTLVLCREEDPRDVNYAPLQENRERLQGMLLEDGSHPEIVALPMPEPLYFEGRRLPASYANFYVGNAAVLVPTFNDPADRAALGVLSELFRDRPVVGVHAVDLVWGLGTLHCLTQQEPE